MRLRLVFIFVFILYGWAGSSQSLPGFSEFVYKIIDTTELRLFVKKPEKAVPENHYPAVIFFFGGGWNSGRITQFLPHAEYFASRGMIAVLADYRVKSRHNTTPFEAVADAKSAVRFLRENAGKLQIDTSRIAASGGSAGGHLAAATATVSGLDEASENLSISSRPNALILFNPVFDNGPTGYGYERIGQRYPEISPMHNIRAGTSPTIVFLGTNDKLIPVETAERYKKKMEEQGCRCDLFLYEGQGHGFFNFREENKDDNKYFRETIKEADRFLVTIGFLKQQ